MALMTNSHKGKFSPGIASAIFLLLYLITDTSTIDCNLSPSIGYQDLNYTTTQTQIEPRSLSLPFINIYVTMRHSTRTGITSYANAYKVKNRGDELSNNSNRLFQQSDLTNRHRNLITTNQYQIQNKMYIFTHLDKKNAITTL